MSFIYKPKQTNKQTTSQDEFGVWQKLIKSTFHKLECFQKMLHIAITCIIFNGRLIPGQFFFSIQTMNCKPINTTSMY